MNPKTNLQARRAEIAVRRSEITQELLRGDVPDARHDELMQQRGALEAQVMTASHRSAIALGLLCLLLSPVIGAVLSLDLWTAALLAVAVVPLTVMGGQAGILQGEQRWGPLALPAFGRGGPHAGGLRRPRRGS